MVPASNDFQGPPKSESAFVCPDFDDSNMHWLWRETVSKLEVYRQRVRERQDVQAASEFARWVQFSGLIKLFTNSAQPEPRRVDGPFLEKLVKDVLWDCGEAFRKQGTPFSLNVSQAERINAKLDLIAGQLSKISPPITVNTASADEDSEPALRVISGGVL